MHIIIYGPQVSFAALMSFFCHYAIVIQYPVPNDSNELYRPYTYSFAHGCICHNRNLSCKLCRFHPTKTHIEHGNYYADKLLCPSCLFIEVIWTLYTLRPTDNDFGSWDKLCRLYAQTGRKRESCPISMLGIKINNVAQFVRRV